MELHESIRFFWRATGDNPCLDSAKVKKKAGPGRQVRMDVSFDPILTSF
jgi:hypothetical protein